MKLQKILIAFAVTTIALLTFQSAFAADFSDLSPSHQNYDAIMYLKARGVINGYPDGTFKPDQAVNRVEALKIIIKGSAGSWAASAYSTPFSDTENEAWYVKYINRAVDIGVVEGYPDGTFKPSQTVNLVESLKIILLTNEIDLSNTAVPTNPYSDAYTGQWYSKYVQYAKNNNLIDADAENRVFPDQGMTRGKLAEAMYRLNKSQDTSVVEETITPTNTLIETTDPQTIAEVEALLAELSTLETLEEYYPYLSAAKLNEIKNLVTMIYVEEGESTDAKKSSIKSHLPGVDVADLFGNNVPTEDTISIEENNSHRKVMITRTMADFMQTGKDFTWAACIGLNLEENTWKIDSYVILYPEMLSGKCISETDAVNLLDPASLVTSRITYSSEYDHKLYINGYFIQGGSMSGGVASANLPIKEGTNQLQIDVGESLKQSTIDLMGSNIFIDAIIGIEYKIEVNAEALVDIVKNKENITINDEFTFSG